MVTTWVMVLVLSLFVIIALLLGYGAYAFAGEAGAAVSPSGRRINMRLEVVWTSLAAMLLFGVFLVAH